VVAIWFEDTKAGYRRPVDVARLARERLGFPSLRPGQGEAVEAAVAGRDVLAVMATGSGKTAIYQLAGMILPGATVVVSPLIALQRDQVEAAGDEGAVELNSTLSEDERELALAEVADGEAEFLLLAPEQLARPETRAELAQANVSLFVVDEAHSISQWGHDFRPDYLELPEAIDVLGRPPVLALTATAAPPVRAEIVERLRMRDALEIVRGFDRPNIRLEVERFHEDHAKRRALLDAVAESQPPGIVYVATQKETEAVAAELAERGVRAAAYHGGLGARRRETVQEAFMSGDEVDVVVATIAFGMGIDKHDVRFVFHLDVSESLDAYYQELGRAGRDGEPALARLFYRPEDLGRRRFFASGKLERDVLDRVARAVRRRRAVPAEELRAQLGLSRSKLTNVVHRLEDAGLVAVTGEGELQGRPGDLDEGLDRAVRAEEDREHFDRSRVEMMRAYAEHDGCRRAFLLGYFGEAFEPPCGNCDGDVDRGEPAPREAAGFAVGDRVRHGEWGAGTVQRVEDEQLTVVFDTVGYKALLAADVAERGLLEHA
jgi:ATP-dependent DNA helicase RecQ